MTIALNVLYINNGEFFMGIEKKYPAAVSKNSMKNKLRVTVFS